MRVARLTFRGQLAVVAALCLASHASAGLDLNEMPEGFEDFWQGNELDAGPALAQKVQEPQAAPPPRAPARQAPSLGARVGAFFKRTREAVPSYFNFEKFVSRFKRKYKKSEAYLRKTIFMKKIVEIFRGRVEFRMGRVGYKQEVNKFSDRSRSEFQMMFLPMGPPPAELSDPKLRDTPAGRAKAAAYRRALEANKKRLEGADQAYLMDITTESAAGSGAARETDEEYARRQLDEHMEMMRRELAGEMNADELEALLESAMREELSGMHFEKMTQSSLGEQDQLKATATLPWPGLLKSEDQAAEGLEPAGAYRAPQLEPSQALDWSRHACFHEIYDQGGACGRCYVYAATTLAEFYGCTERGPGRPIKRRKFSKDFVTDCAQKFSPNVMGCAGGSIYDTLKFIAHAGVNNIKQWRSTRQTSVKALLQELAGNQPDPLDMRCPLDASSVPVEQWGDIKVVMNPKPVHPNKWIEALSDGPLAVSVQMPPVGVDSYAGGVHDGAGCEGSGMWHAMLLVGYGLSDRGEPYWRFRNSFGPEWGDGGHFNLAMSIPAACLSESLRVYREPCQDCE